MPLLNLNGSAVEYEQHGAGPDLLLLHSLLTELTVFERVLPALAQRHRVTLINLPGFGRSAPRVLGSVGAYADHVAEVMAALKLPATTDVFGNGFGGFVALQLAIRHSRCFRRLLVADAVAVFPEAARVPFRMMAEKVTTGGMATVLDAAIGRMFPADFAAANPQTIAARKAALAAVDAACFARACLGLAELDLSAQLQRIANPTLVLCGSLDQTTPPALARLLADGIPGASYRDIANSGHCPMLEQPEALTAAIGQFAV